MLDKTRGAPLFCARFWRPGFVGFHSAFPASGHLDRNHTGQATAQRLHWQTGPEPAAIPAVTIQFYDSPNRRNGMSDQEPNRSEKRLQDIERRIAKMQGDRDDAAKPSRAALPVGMGAILSRVATELVAGVVVGAFMGWVLDRWLGTSPLFLVLMFFLGASAGMLNVWRMMSGRGMATGYFDEHRQDAGADKQERDGE